MAHGGFRVGSGRKLKVLPVARPTGLQWYCVRTDFGFENTANEGIRKLGFQTLFPRLHKAEVPARRSVTGRMVAKRPAVSLPLFRRYLFVSFDVGDLHWRHIVSLRGVDRILSASADRPTIVPDAAMLVIMDQLDELGLLLSPNAEPVVVPAPVITHAEPAPQAHVTTGATLLVTGGAFDGLRGLCTKSDSDRVSAIMSIFGREAVIEFPRTMVSVVTELSIAA